VQIAAYKVLNSSNFGQLSDWIAALDDIIANHPEVDAVNMSLVASSFAGACDSFLPAGTAAISTLRAAGVLTFVSSGNNQTKQAMTWPACVTDAVAVGAVWDANVGSPFVFGCADTPSLQDQVTCWSNSSPMLDLLAPGAPTTSAGHTTSIATSTFYGTSMAAPHATGLAALLKEAEPALTAAQIEQRMKETGILRTDAANGRTTPRIDALNAINGTIPPTPTPVPTPTPAPDFDADGCSDVEENGPNHSSGGQRDYTNFWDFYDVNGTKAIDLQDTIVVLQHFGHLYNGGAYVDATDDKLDRSAPNPSAPWLSEEADNGVDLTDALANLKSFGDNCVALP
jgi:subtilisin family serine protease